MRNLDLVVLFAMAGCGHKATSTPSEAGPKDAGAIDGAPIDAVPIDAPPLIKCTPISGSNITMRHVGKVDGVATLATSPPNDGRLFVIEETGPIRVFENEILKPTPFLDLTDTIVSGGEQGLLGLAFDPNYATNRQFYVFYTALNPNHATDPHNAWVDVLARYTTSVTDSNVADPTSGTIILSIPDYAVNHNGGMLEFGADGFLYVGTGDGGSAGDPDRNGQNKNALLGKILRLDVAHPANGKPYGIPSDNPFAAGGGLGEIFIIGVRNPWRWSFDRGTGDMWIGDVGQAVIEELDVLPAGQQAGRNLGWSVFEGNTCCVDQVGKCSQVGGQQACDMTGKTFPVDTRNHSTGWNAIIGGQVYRGSCFPDLVGYYYYTDNGDHPLARAKLQPDGSVTIVDLGKCSVSKTMCSVATDCTGTGNVCSLVAWPASPSSLHADARGELYETTTSGDVFALEAGP